MQKINPNCKCESHATVLCNDDIPQLVETYKYQIQVKTGNTSQFPCSEDKIPIGKE